MRSVRVRNHACVVVLPLLLAVVAGCNQKESEAERLQRRINAEHAQSQRRLDGALTAIESKLAKQEDTLRRAQESQLPLEQRMNLAITHIDAWGEELGQITKQIDEIKAAAEAGRLTGAWNPTHKDRLTAAMERLDKLDKGWDAVAKGFGPELKKLEKAEPPKKK